MAIPGPEVKRLLKKKYGLKLQDVASQMGMTVQNLGHHLRKEEADYGFLLKLRDKLKIDLLSENGPENKTGATTKKDTSELPELMKMGLEANRDHGTFLTHLSAGLINVQNDVRALFETTSKHTDEIKEHDRKFHVVNDILDKRSYILEEHDERLKKVEKLIDRISHEHH